MPWIAAQFVSKDHRTDHEVGDVNSVFDGDLDALMQAYLLRQ